MPAILADLAAPILKSVADLATKPPDPSPSCEELQGRFRDLVVQFAQQAAGAGVAADDIAHAKYALVALIDETVMLSPLSARDAWLSQPLQLQYFDEVAAGEEFYNRLDLVRPTRKADVLEVFWLCLAFGFKGKYGDKKGGERRHAIADALQHEIAQIRGSDAKTPLSPQATAAAARRAATRLPLLSLPWWLLPLLVVLVIAVVFAASRLLVQGPLSDLADTAARTPPPRTAKPAAAPPQTGLAPLPGAAGTQSTATGAP